MKVLALTAILAALLPASAPEDTWTVTPGGSVTATAPVEIRNTDRGWSIDCAGATFTGSAESGAGDTTEPLIEFDEAAFQDCTGPDGVGYTVTMTSGVQLEMYASSYDAGTGKTTGTLFGFHLNLVGTNRCQADIADPTGNLGTADAAFTNGSSVLGLDGGNMGVTFVNFACPSGFIATEDRIVVAARLTVTPPQTVSSP
ncbi:hypothetical protein [Actinomadura madurae]|uniref:hypothetical protein n=1 Tax=Actinomadura madurae TaxID=1993 RepID=UPI0020D1F53C|nr:hypothetical protein [Actinomadura madurae]MCP9970496.1 hypothetical protein [Actinomadura madurae]MCP9982976.1 hypothetical protein [Actinomadura madurae]MCQ0005474.1 hypothetical protein [Actinomadura madurae]MCQ0019213.1 hypothetical protein [Actinomadura madurae]